MECVRAFVGSCMHAWQSPRWRTESRFFVLSASVHVQNVCACLLAGWLACAIAYARKCVYDGTPSACVRVCVRVAACTYQQQPHVWCVRCLSRHHSRVTCTNASCVFEYANTTHTHTDTDISAYVHIRRHQTRTYHANQLSPIPPRT